MTLFKEAPLVSIFLELSRVPDDTILGKCIRIACADGVPVKKIAQQIYEQSIDNRQAVVRCIGESLMVKIESICK